MLKNLLPLQRKLLLWMAFLCIFLGICVVIASVLGAARIELTSLFAAFFSQSSHFGEGASNDSQIVLYLRFPRILLAAIVGATLAVGGAVFQSLFRNPLAEPYVLGVSGGAAMGAVLSITFGFNLPGLPLGAFAGAILAIGLIVLVSSSRNISITSEEIILSGVVINAFFSAIIVFVISISSAAQMQSITFWLMGDLALAGYGEVLPLSAIFLLCFAIIYFQARHLNALMLGEENAAQLGVSTRRVRNILVVSSSLAIGAAVSFSGIIGFIGIIVPHIIKMLCGLDNRIVLPASALLGAAFLIIVDTAARTLLAPSELPIGVISAVVGVPFFVSLLWKKRRC